MGERSVNFLIRWLPYQSINGDAGANQWKQIDVDGDMWCLFKIPDINIHLSIDWSINQSTEGQNGRRYTLVGQQTEGRIDRTEITDIPTGRTVARTDRTQYYHNPKNYIYQYWFSSKYKSIDRRDNWYKRRCINRTQDRRIDMRGRKEVKTHKQEGGGTNKYGRTQ